MNDIGYLQFPALTVPVRLETASPVARSLMEHLPISSTAHQIGGEIYFRAKGVEIGYDGTQTRDFEKGDVAYWRSPTGESVFSIAMFYGNTSFSGGRAPTASSPCIRIGRMLTDADGLEALRHITTGETVRFALESR